MSSSSTKSTATTPATPRTLPAGYINCTKEGDKAVTICPIKAENAVECCGQGRCCPGVGPHGNISPAAVVLFTWICILFVMLLVLILFLLVRCIIERQRERSIIQSLSASDSLHESSKEITVCYVGQDLVEGSKPKCVVQDIADPAQVDGKDNAKKAVILPLPLVPPSVRPPPVSPKKKEDEMMMKDDFDDFNYSTTTASGSN